jgi:hypothetical protein
LVVLLAGTALIFAVMGAAGAPLNTSQAPNGIVSFEFAWNIENAEAMLASWDSQARMRAGFIQGLDFLFLLVYSSAIGLGCLVSAAVLQRLGWPLAAAGRWLAWGLWLAALFDFVENVALVMLLFGQAAPEWPPLAGVCASAKFGLIFAGLVYIFYAGAVRLAESLLKRKGQQST